MSNVKDEEIKYLQSLRNQMLDELRLKVPDIKVNGSMEYRHPGNLNVMLHKNDARDLIFSLQPKIAFSTGSACTSGIQEPSHVLKAIGLTTEEAEHSFRVTVGRFTDESDVSYFTDIVQMAIES